jgi:hypothetical protein
MKKQIILKNGRNAALTLIVFGLIQFFILIPKFSSESSEVVGYLSMFVSMIFVFIGIRQYRDQKADGNLGFWEALKIGALIAIIPSLGFGILDTIYTQIINPEWSAQYYAQYIEKLKASTPAEQWAATLAKIEKERSFFSNPVMLFLVMTLTVFIIGIIVSIISGITLKRSGVAATQS